MKITIITPYFPHPNRGKYFGAERYTENLAISLKRLGNDIIVVTNYWNGGKRFDNYNGIKILRVGDTGLIFKSFWKLDQIHYLTFGLNVIRKKHFKYYCDSDAILIIKPIIFSRLFKIRNIKTISIFFHFVKKFLGLNYLEKSQFKLHGNVIAISEHSKKDIMKYYEIDRNKIKVIYTGVDLEKFNPKNYSKKIREKYGSKIILYSGLMVGRKDIPVLLRAMKYVIKELPDLQLILTGDGPSIESYKNLSKSLNIRKNTNFLGFVYDQKLLSLLATSDIFIFPSKLEGFGQVILESLASGTPVICSDIPPMNNIIDQAGKTFKIGNAKDLSDKIIQLFKDKNLYNELKKNTLRVAKKYTWKNIGKQYQKYIEEIIES